MRPANGPRYAARELGCGQQGGDVTTAAVTWPAMCGESYLLVVLFFKDLFKPIVSIVV